MNPTIPTKNPPSYQDISKIASAFSLPHLTMNPTSQTNQPEDCYTNNFIDPTEPYEPLMELEEEVKQDGIVFTKGFEYEVYSDKTLESRIQSHIKELIEESGISESMAFSVLQKKNWSLNKALVYLQNDARFDDYANGNSQPLVSSYDCPICFDTVNSQETYGLSCGHLFCKPCYVTYLVDATKSGQTITTKCPEAKCKEIVPDSVFIELLPTELQTMYKKFRLNNIVESSANLMWCPALECTNVIELNTFTKTEKKSRNIRCECGNYFCSSCKEIAHRPITCEMMGEWSLMFGSTATLNDLWKKNNTKKCPGCRVDIEKNQGCMTMGCQNCKWWFCWVCLNRLDGHVLCRCNSFKPSESSSLPSSKLPESKRLEKFTFYKDGYENHFTSIKQAEIKRSKVMNNMESVSAEILTKNQKEKIETSFMKEALDLIVEARRAVTMTYAYAYYKMDSGKNNSEKELFEHQQGILWSLLDQFDEYTDQYQNRQRLLDSCVDVFGVANKAREFKVDIVNRTHNVEKACNAILSHIENDVQARSEHNDDKTKSENTKKISENNKKKSENPSCRICNIF